MCSGSSLRQVFEQDAITMVNERATAIERGAGPVMLITAAGRRGVWSAAAARHRHARHGPLI